MRADAPTPVLPAVMLQPRMRPERFIAASRVVLAITALLAVWLDPTQPARFEAAVHFALFCFVLYALAIFVLLLRRAAVPLRLPLATHVGDLLAFALLFLATSGPGSPAFLFWIYSVLTAAMRWQWRGTVWTVLALLACYFAIGATDTQVLEAWDMDVSRFLIRAAFLVVMATLVAALGTFETRLRREMLLLALWPREDAPRDPGRMLCDTLGHAADVVGSPRVMVVCEYKEEPSKHVAQWNRGRFDRSVEPPNKWVPLVAPELAKATFLCADASADAPIVLVSEHSMRLNEVHLRPLHADFQGQFGIGGVLSAPLEGQSVHGRIFWLSARATADDLMLADIVAAQVTARMDRAYMFEVLHETAATEERLRIARDLHDGLLQSLAAAGLQLEAARAVLERRSPTDAERLARVQQAIASEQRDLRGFIRELRPRVGDAPDTAPATVVNLKGRLAELAAKVQQNWGMTVDVRTAGLDEPLTPTLARHALLMVNEAVTNAARHGHASTVRVEVEVLAEQLCISIFDDGAGFSGGGKDGGGRRAEAPATLRQRVEQLGGSLLVESSRDGTRVQIAVPLDVRVR